MPALETLEGAPCGPHHAPARFQQQTGHDPRALGGPAGVWRSSGRCEGAPNRAMIFALSAVGMFLNLEPTDKTKF
jgi:hypothetical protein